MKIKLESSGDITRMTNNFSADTNSFSPGQADQIPAAIDLPEDSAPPPKGVADYFEYVITVEKEGSRVDTIKTTDITMLPSLKPVINF
jgi:hypothetical protein